MSKIPKFLKYAFFPFVVWTLYLISFYPGIMTNDSVNQWWQLSVFHFNAYHSPIDTLFEWLVTRVRYSPASIAMSQIVLLSITYGYAMTVLEQCGIKKSILRWMTLIIGILPVNGMMVITLWSDIPYSVAMLFLTALMIHVVATRGEWLKSRKHVIVLTVALTLVIALRHNGIMPVFATIVGLLILYKNVRRQMLLVSFMTVICVVFIQFPVYKLLRVDPLPSSFPLQGQIHEIGALVHAGVPIRKDESRILNAVYPISSWNSQYNKYTSDWLYFDPQFNKNLLDTNAQFRNEFLHVWMNLSIHNPSVVLADRLIYQSSLCWQISQPRDGYTYTVSTEIVPNGLMFHLKTHSLWPWLHTRLLDVIKFTNQPNVIWLFWRPALCNLMTLLLGAWFVYRHKMRSIVVLLPTLFNVIGLWITMPAQDVRYFFPEVTIFPVILIIAFAYRTTHVINKVHIVNEKQPPART